MRGRIGRVYPCETWQGQFGRDFRKVEPVCVVVAASRQASDVLGSDFVRSLPAPCIDAGGRRKNAVMMGLEHRK